MGGKWCIRLVLLAALAGVSACSLSLNGGGQSSSLALATQRAEYVAEATAIRAAVLAGRTQLAATVAPMNTAVAAQNAQNRLLYATVVADHTAVPGRRVGSVGAGSSGMDAGAAGAARFEITGTAATVNENDGCPLRRQSQFSPSAARIYITLIGYDLTPGISLEARWFFGEAPVASYRWQTDTSAAELCIFFYLETEEFQARLGQWWVEVLADGRPLAVALGFSVE